MGRLLRGPDDDHGDDPVTDDQATDDKSLVTDDQKTDDQKTDDQKTDDQKTDDQKVDDKKADDKTDDQQKPEPLTVESLSVPEGFELQPELSNKFLEILNGQMEPKDRANALIALHAETINAALEADSSAWENMQNEWKAEVKADPDIGGAKLQPTLNNIGKLINEFGSNELKGAFDLTGAGNNPHVIKFLGKIADALVEGNFFTSGSPADQKDDPNAAARRMFPSMKG